MNRILFSILTLLLLFQPMFAQDKNYTKHTVTSGETITQIAVRYNVTPHDIYQLNPDAQKGIKESDVLLIPTSLVKTTSSSGESLNTTAKSHVAQPKETLYSIARDYNVSIADLKESNPEIFANGLKIGQTVKIPNGKAAVDANVETPKQVKESVESKSSPTVSIKENNIYHIVEPKETKFGIAKKYGITVQELEQRNPQIVSNLPVGFKLIISGKALPDEPANNRPVAEKPKPAVTEISSGDEIITTETTRTLTKNGYANYEVKSGDTMYSLSQYFKITPEELVQLNPTMKDGLKTGMILKVPGKGNINIIGANKTSEPNKTETKTEAVTAPKPVVKSEPKPTVKSESKPTPKVTTEPEKPQMKTGIVPNKDRKQLALLLPFNAAKIQSDTLKTMEVRLKKDAFLNMTLDFYSGALMAIDSAKTLGLNVDVKIFDSEESKLSSNVENVIKNNNLQTADAVIGPFYQQYVEKAADLLKDKNVPVISPLSKEIGQPYPNLFQSMPPTDFGKMAMFNYMLSKKGNIIVVSDPKKVYNKDFITKNYPAAKFVALLDNGALDVNDLKAQLVKGVINYVVLDSERTGLILGTTNVLLNEMSNFQIQLVIIEPNDTLDFEEISMKRLTILKMLYPSLTRENSTTAAMEFEKKYKEINKVFPSQYAIRGFDVTFDTLLRITQGKSFTDSAVEVKSEQIESKFEYAKKGSEGYANKGIYIMEYQNDLSVKQVN
ncbi:LysM peptidoglycan-binding domain-containing protein [Flavobacterium sp. CYK-4]|uniref:LysM peptidoglycan-binding domain-containing protein n=1 Tax=Flavobacterium lotistagni TaxID=2709660 RepID=UPI0014077CBC|nr:LysM peptidoglycan-binding domain-containing protein [Flavobacterium lotistagni]NHM07769.1 LysM peptidoglycan-binding domain-containing protein [Flavobacterium lotistagni]